MMSAENKNKPDLTHVESSTQLANSLPPHDNRRRAFRVPPDEKSPIKVAIEWGEGSAYGRMADISTTGIAVSVSTDAAEIPSHPYLLRLKFNLPVNEAPFRLAGSIPYSRVKEGNIHYGIQFDWDQTQNHYRQEALISSYVLKRQQEIIQGVRDKFSPVQKSHIPFFTDIPLYFKPKGGKYTLYKSPGKLISEERLNQSIVPELYINQADRIKAIKILQKSFNDQLRKDLVSGSSGTLHATLCNLLKETFRAHPVGALGNLLETIDILVAECNKSPEHLNALLSASSKEEMLFTHSVNVMALTLNFCFFHGYSLEDIKGFGLSALLHDVGKIELPDRIISAQRKLTPGEFDMFKSHPTVGYNLIKKESRIDDWVATGILEHHEKLDGSGYPEGRSDISFIGQLLAIIDSYEALTNSHRLSRRAKEPIGTLAQLITETETGKFNKDLFEQFCHSLT